MPAPSPFEQSWNLRFVDATVESAYLRDRNQRDAPRAAHALLALATLIGLLGAIVVGVNLRQHLPTPTAWLVMRFGIIVPTLVATGFLCRSQWGRDRLQIVLGAGAAIAVGVHALEWFVEWTAAMPLRTLWVVPITVLWAVAMTLPFNARATVGTTLGVFAIALGGVLALIEPKFGAPAVATTALAYLLSAIGLVVIARWRERDHRELFVHRQSHERLVAELRAQYETLQQLITQRNEIVAGVLHDLRSPLTAMLLGTEMLRAAETLPAATRASILDDIQRSAKRVDSFANRFLEQRLLERAAAKPTLADVALDPVVERAIAHAQVSAAHKHQSIQLTVVAIGQSVVADELLLDRAITNLLDNAVKYSPLGASITVRVDVAPGPAPRALLTVTDSGPGLSTAEQTRLFQPYIVLGKKPTGGEPSTGLGLSLVKHCVESMGGAVGCESEPGRGSTFWLALQRASQIANREGARARSSGN